MTGLSRNAVDVREQGAHVLETKNRHNFARQEVESIELDSHPTRSGLNRHLEVGLNYYAGMDHGLT